MGRRSSPPPMFDRPPLQPIVEPMNSTSDTKDVGTPSKVYPLCRSCQDGTYATQSMQPFARENCPWHPYCDPCGKAFASVIKDSQGRDPEIRVLATPPTGKAFPKVVRAKAEPIKGPKAVKGSKAALPAPTPVAPSPVADVRPRMSLAEAMRRTAPRTPPALPPPPAPPPKSAKKSLQDALRDVEGYDLLTMLGMKR